MWKVAIIVSYFAIVNTAPQKHLDFTSINEFALKLLDNTYAFQESFGRKNVAISPLSVWTTFTLLSEAASGDTFQELKTSLGLPDDALISQGLHMNAVDIMRKGNQDVIVKGTAAMFIDDNFNIHQEFCQAANIFTNLYRVDNIGNTTALAEEINYFLCEATNGKIRNSVTPDILEDLKMILVDALYFKAPWKHPFDPTQTREEPFYDSLGRMIGSVNMMYHKASHTVGESSLIGASVLEMTYGRDEQYAMLILLPFEGMPIKNLLKNLSAKPYAEWMTEFRSEGSLPSIDVYVPRFKMSTKTDLVPPLQYTGIRRIFDVKSAELPGIASEPLYVSKTIQNVEIDVNEDGTEAASTTIVGLQDRFLGQRFEANKEFVFLIVEKKSGGILFAGVYGEPSLY